MHNRADPDGTKLDYTAADRTALTHNAIPMDDVATHQILEGLARLHPLVIVTDFHGGVLWMSDELAMLRGDVAQHLGHSLCDALSSLPGAREQARFHEQITRIESHLRHHDTLEDVRLDLGARDGVQRSIDLRAFKIDTRDARSLVVTIIEPCGLSLPAKAKETIERDDRDVLDSVLAASSDAVFVVNRFGFVTYANAAVLTVLGIDPDRMLGQPVALSMPESKGLSHVLTSLRGALAIDEPELRIELPDGGERWIGIRAQPQLEADGERRDTVIFARDVTGQVLERVKLERKNADLESYVHSVSHDLRSPLVSLLGFTRLLRQDYEHLFDETGRHFAERIEQSGRTMQALIEDLLELSRIGASNEQRTFVDPRSVLLQLQAELKLQLEEHGASIQIPDNPPLVLCDRTRLYQLFSNLVGNAIHHMGEVEDRRIEVTIVAREADHLITVADRGVGIRPEDQERIFEVFQSHSPSRSPVAAAPKAASSGVGLAIVKRIAETHGGRAWVESAPGEGARFQISLPHST